jgi:hypothetical protein
MATAVWSAAQWAGLEPETALSCTLDDPQSIDDLDT